MTNAKTAIIIIFLAILAALAICVIFNRQIVDYLVAHGWDPSGTLQALLSQAKQRTPISAMKRWHFPVRRNVSEAAQDVRRFAPISTASRVAVYDNGIFASPLEGDTYSIAEDGRCITLDDGSEVSWKLANLSEAACPVVSIRVDGGEIFYGSVVDGIATVVIPRSMRVSHIQVNPQKSGPIVLLF